MSHLHPITTVCSMPTFYKLLLHLTQILLLLRGPLIVRMRYSKWERYMGKFALVLVLGCGVALAQTAPTGGQEGNASAANSQGIRRQGVGGTITAVGPGKMTLKTIDGKMASVILGEKTQFHVDR